MASFIFPLHFAFIPFSKIMPVLFVALAPYSSPIAHRMTSQWNSQPGMTRSLSISLWFGSYITPCFAWHTCLPNPVTDWKSLISTDRLHLIIMHPHVSKLAQGLSTLLHSRDCLCPEKHLTPCWKPVSVSLPSKGSPLLMSLCPPCSEVGKMWQKTTGLRTHIWGRGETRYKEQRLWKLRKMLTRERGLYQRSFKKV